MTLPRTNDVASAHDVAGKVHDTLSKGYKEQEDSGPGTTYRAGGEDMLARSRKAAYQSIYNSRKILGNPKA